MEVGGQRHVPAALHPLYRRLTSPLHTHVIHSVEKIRAILREQSVIYASLGSMFTSAFLKVIKAFRQVYKISHISPLAIDKLTIRFVRCSLLTGILFDIGRSVYHFFAIYIYTFQRDTTRSCTD